MPTKLDRPSPCVPFLCAALGATALASVATAQQQIWARQFGTSTLDSLFALAPDGAGGAFAAGFTNGSLGAANQGNSDVWLARYGADGQPGWLRQFGTASQDRAFAVARDELNGGVFVAGRTGGNLGGPNQGAQDAWVARYDAAGAQAWLIQFGTATLDGAFALAYDGAGGVFVGGETDGSLAGPNQGSFDPWLARYDSAGELVWIHQFGTSAWEDIRGMAPDGSGGFFAGGDTEGDLGGTNQGATDGWLARYDGAGNQIWIVQFGTAAADSVYGLAPAPGGVYIGGYTSGGLGGANLGATDVWLARYDMNGNRLWIRQFGTAAGDFAYALAPDGHGGVYVTGSTQGSLGGPSAGNHDAWLAHFSPGGAERWRTQLGTAAADYAYAAAPGEQGVLIGGETQGSLGGPSAGNFDAWLVLYSAPPPLCPADWNEDGVVNSTDISAFITSWLESVSTLTLLADFNGDGQVNSTDISAFITAWLGAVQGGC